MNDIMERTLIAKKKFSSPFKLSSNFRNLQFYFHSFNGIAFFSKVTENLGHLVLQFCSSLLNWEFLEDREI